jgi:predicted nucleic acid-binding protein
VNEAVLDASVVLKWFHAEGEHHLEGARHLRAQFEAGELRVLAPQLLWLELLNVAARSWGWPQAQLEQLAATLEKLDFDVLDPELPRVAKWAANGLTAYDAAYVAVAEHAGVQLITDDDGIVASAPQLATALGGLQVPPAPDQNP